MVNNNANEKAVIEILKSVAYLLENYSKQTTKIYDGILLKNNNDGSWSIQYNGEKHIVTCYGNGTYQVGNIVKVYIPQGNQTLSYFI